MARGRWRELQAAARSRRARAEAIASVAAAEEQFRRALERRRRPYPTSGDPNIIGEHEVAPVRCGSCDEVIPWMIIKGWRD